MTKKYKRGGTAAAITTNSVVATGFDLGPKPDGAIVLEFFGDDGRTLNQQAVTEEVLRDMPILALLTWLSREHVGSDSDRQDAAVALFPHIVKVLQGLLSATRIWMHAQLVIGKPPTPACIAEWAQRVGEPMLRMAMKDTAPAN